MMTSGGRWQHNTIGPARAGKQREGAPVITGSKTSGIRGAHFPHKAVHQQGEHCPIRHLTLWLLALGRCVRRRCCALKYHRSSILSFDVLQPSGLPSVDLSCATSEPGSAQLLAPRKEIFVLCAGSVRLRLAASSCGRKETKEDGEGLHHRGGVPVCGVRCVRCGDGRIP